MVSQPEPAREPSDEGTSILARTSSRPALGEPDTVESVLTHVIALFRQEAAKRGKLLSEATFAIGVLNTILITYVMGAYPGYFWIVYLFEGAILIPGRWHMQRHEDIKYPTFNEKTDKVQWKTRTVNGQLYWLEYCWVANFMGTLVLILIIMERLITNSNDGETEVRKFFYKAFFGMACGPLMWSVAFLGNALVFHDINNTASLFIHLLPSLGLYTLRWHMQAVKEAVPGVFNLTYVEEILDLPFGQRLWQVWQCQAIVYAVWAVLYFALFASCLLNHVNKNPNLDTNFHMIMRTNAEFRRFVCQTVFKRSKEESQRRWLEGDWEVKDVVMYQIFHAFAACGVTSFLGSLCFISREWHAIGLIINLLMAVKNGSSRYTYYILKSGQKVLEGELKLAREDGRASSALLKEEQAPASHALATTHV